MPRGTTFGGPISVKRGPIKIGGMEVTFYVDPIDDLDPDTAELGDVVGAVNEILAALRKSGVIQTAEGE